MSRTEIALNWLEKNTTTLDAESHQIKMSHIATLRAVLTPKTGLKKGEQWTHAAFEKAQELINKNWTYAQIVAHLNENFEGVFTAAQLSYWITEGAITPKSKRKVYHKR